MMYCGFVLMWEVKVGDKYITQFHGPESTIEEIHKRYDDLKLLEPAVKNIRVCRLVNNPSNPRLY